MSFLSLVLAVLAIIEVYTGQTDRAGVFALVAIVFAIIHNKEGDR